MSVDALGALLAMTVITLPDPCLVVLVGVSGSGKSSFARKHFASTEVISSDFSPGLVVDTETGQTAPEPTFRMLNAMASARLGRGHIVVIDATNVQQEARAALIALARRHDVLPIAIVLDVPAELCLERNAARPVRDPGPQVVNHQRRALRGSMNGLEQEGFRRVFRLSGVEQIEAATIERGTTRGRQAPLVLPSASSTDRGTGSAGRTSEVGFRGHLQVWAA